MIVDVGTPRQLQAFESTALARVASFGGRPAIVAAVDDGLEVAVEDLGVEVLSEVVVLLGVVLVTEVVLEEGPALFCGPSRRSLLLAARVMHVVIVVVLCLLSETRTTRV